MYWLDAGAVITQCLPTIAIIKQLRKHSKLKPNIMTFVSLKTNAISIQCV